MRIILIVVTMFYVLSFLAGWFLISVGAPFAMEIKRGVHEMVLTEQPFLSVIDLIRQGELLKAIIATFLVNFALGAFLTTTLPGIIPFLGALVIAAVSLARGFTIGATYPEVLAASPASFLVGMGTLILELGAYVFSGAAGINVALAPLFPRRYAVRSRLAAFRAAWVDAFRIFVIVAVLIILGAIWEMTGLFLLTRG
jgi:hypothetical protein